MGATPSKTNDDEIGPKFAEDAKLSSLGASPSTVSTSSPFETPNSSPHGEGTVALESVVLTYDRFSLLETAEDSLVSKGNPRGNKSEVSLNANHLSCWLMEPTIDGSDLVNELVANRYRSPMVEKYGEHTRFADPGERVMGNILLDPDGRRRPSSSSGPLRTTVLRAHACKQVYWDPTKVRAAVITCGGLCPGLNSIIRGISRCLVREYGLTGPIIGFTSGYNGLSDPETYPPVELTIENMRDIHLHGGSVIKAGRGGFDAARSLETLRKLQISLLFVIGGDGTLTAAHQLYEAARTAKASISIIGVPKSIDNDVLYFDRTFGFDSAVATASSIIKNGWVEAKSCFKGVGIIKLMGRDAGFVAAHASLASGLVDMCLVPEVRFEKEDMIAYVDALLERKGHMVIVVAEGAGQELLEASDETDATGHKKYGDIGTYLRDVLNAHLKASGGRCFYIDPSYIIRSCPVEPVDHIYCTRLATDAAHVGMRGFTGVCVGAIHNANVLLPMRMVAAGKKTLNVHGSLWGTCVLMTNMPPDVAFGRRSGKEKREKTGTAFQSMNPLNFMA